MLRSVVWWTVHGVSMDRSAFIFRAKGFQNSLLEPQEVTNIQSRYINKLYNLRTH
jgi:hypothetical protein